MKKLTSHEKINFRNAMARKKVKLPIITMSNVKHFWPMCYGYLPLKKHFLFSR